MEKCDSAALARNVACQELNAAIQSISGLLDAERNRIAGGWDELSGKNAALTTDNGGADADDADRLEINAGGQTVTATRGTLTQLKGTRLEALFSGRWENQLQRDESGRVFLDVNPACFCSIVDYLNELKIAPPDGPPDPPCVDKEDEVYLDYLISLLRLDDALFPSRPKQGDRLMRAGGSAGKVGNNDVSAQEEWRTAKLDGFPEKLQEALKDEREALIVYGDELKEQECVFEEEENFIKFFVQGETKDIVQLDVSGKRMAVKRSTIGLCKNSVLAKQFNDPLWGNEPNTHAEEDPAEWSCEDVAEWAAKLKGLPKPAVEILSKHKITGFELLSLKRDHLEELGITRLGTLAALTEAIARLRSSRGIDATLIEHSPYCFGKIVDQLRLRAMCQSSDVEPPSPYVREPDRKRFKRIVDFYFPGECSDFITGKLPESKILSPSDVNQIYTWLNSEGVQGDMSLLYRASRDGWLASNFHAQCDDQGATITVIQSIGGYVFGGFADTPWKSSGENKPSPKAFLFSLKCYRGLGPTKMGKNRKDTEWAVYHERSYGPTFGAGHHICVYDNANLNSNSSTNFSGGPYMLPLGQSVAFLTGAPNFIAAEIEVYGIK